ncbi:MAG: N-acetylmuramoyl-L-alanine amidase, partial [Candidatus Sumerlaeota bacterium]|nr:N-acetylmuramoyl-L-alanine amidase [Candidatus Sumerlaeota bacterium]
MKKFHIIPVCAALTLILTCSLTPEAPCGETFLQSLQGWRIFIDSGTGNELSKIPFVEKTKDTNDVTEADINMRVALFLADFFKKAGAEILLSREPAQPLPKLDERLKKADEFKANLILSINHDREKNPKVNYVN